MWPFDIGKKRAVKEEIEDKKYIEDLESNLLHAKTIVCLNGVVYDTASSEYLITIYKGCNSGKRFGYVRTLWRTSNGNYFAYTVSFLDQAKEIHPIALNRAIDEVAGTCPSNTIEGLNDYVFSVLGVWPFKG